MTMSDTRIDDLLDTARYPLDDPESPGWQRAVATARRELDDVGCSVLAGFVRAGLVDELRGECGNLAPQAHYAVETVNAYNIAIDAVLPDDHPGRITMERGNAFVARDRIPGDAIIQQLYVSAAFQRFIAACFGLPRLYELGDPLAGLCLNVISPGKAHPWHYDTNEFTVSMLTQAADDGGDFEYCPNIRSADAENLDDVRAVLTGDGERFVRRLALEPGDLQLFKGRYSLHQVRRVAGDRARHSVIFAYSERPGTIGSVERTRQLFGRVLPEHVSTSVGRVRGDELLD